jgi:hypothetical protein
MRRFDLISEIKKAAQIRAIVTMATFMVCLFVVAAVGEAQKPVPDPVI